MGFQGRVAALLDLMVSSRGTWYSVGGGVAESGTAVAIVCLIGSTGATRGRGPIGESSSAAKYGSVHGGGGSFLQLSLVDRAGPGVVALVALAARASALHREVAEGRHQQPLVLLFVSAPLAAPMWVERPRPGVVVPVAVTGKLALEEGLRHADGGSLRCG